MAEKTCTLCGKTLPLDDFGLDARGRAGRQARCRRCHAAVVRRNPSRSRMKEYRRKSRDRRKEAARRRLQRAVAAGTVERPSACEACGRECVPQGHHDDYEAPLAVRWLCATCHGKEHRA